MSRRAVRDRIVTELEAYAAANPPIAFHQTINTAAKPTESQWLSVEFFTDYSEPICLEGGKVTERGTIDVSVFASAGTGYAQASALADAIEDYLAKLDLSSSDLYIENTIPASEAAAGDAVSRFYQLIVSFEYRHHYTR